jgi:hypothetical protein
MTQSRRSFVVGITACSSVAVLSSGAASQAPVSAKAPSRDLTARDLTPQQVRAHREVLGLHATDEDLAEVTDRINAIDEALLALDHPDLDAVEPVTVFV